MMTCGASFFPLVARHFDARSPRDSSIMGAVQYFGNGAYPFRARARTSDGRNALREAFAGNPIQLSSASSTTTEPSDRWTAGARR